MCASGRREAAPLHPGNGISTVTVRRTYRATRRTAMALVPPPLRRLRERSVRSSFCSKCHHRIFFEQKSDVIVVAHAPRLRSNNSSDWSAGRGNSLLKSNPDQLQLGGCRAKSILLFVRSDPYNPKPWLVEEPAVVESGCGGEAAPDI